MALTTKLFRRTGSLKANGWLSVHSYKVWDPDRTQINEDDALLADGLPAIADPHPTDFIAVVTEKRAEEITEGNGEEVYWRVDVIYQHLGFDTPLTENPIVRFGTVQYLKVAEEGWQEVGGSWVETLPIQNSAEDAFDPPLQKPVSMMKISIAKNYSADAFDPNWLNTFKDSSNVYAMRMVGLDLNGYQARMLDIQAEPGSWLDTNSVKQYYYRITFLIEVSSDQEWGQYMQVLDQGFNYLDESDKLPIMLDTSEGERVAPKQPQKLNGSGEVLAVGDTPVYLSFLTYEPKDWMKTLNLPAELPATKLAGG